ncbi:13379_t:CDS:2, partial [Cetraspora pellucida]
IDIQKLREKKIAVCNALLDHFSIFKASLTQYVKAQKELNKGVKLLACHKQENTTVLQ